MNLNVLEKLARQVIKGENVAEKSTAMFNNGYLTPAEHRSLKSLSWQIAANVQANGSPAATQAFRPTTSWG